MDSTTASLHRWEDIAREELINQIERRIVTGERAMLAQVFLKKGSVVPMHDHPNEQLTYILEGSLRMEFSDGTHDVIVHAGEVLVIPAGVPHGALALEDTFDLDVFSPPRQDWLDKTDVYLRSVSLDAAVQPAPRGVPSARDG
jgi:quercetin dioxygenase-like cupin family protein